MNYVTNIGINCLIFFNIITIGTYSEKDLKIT